MLDTITPEEILSEGHQKELTTYKGVMVSKSHAERDMFKINLLNSMNKNGFLNNKALIVIGSILLILIIIPREILLQFSPKMNSVILHIFIISPYSRLLI